MSTPETSTSRARNTDAAAVEDRETDIVDFKMVTFSLGGKDYGIDIMKIKEIAKFAGFTYVPNCPSYVRGVYNLRGDIISVIDLRRFFSIPVTDDEQGGPHNGLILRLSQSIIGVVVDSIDKVVGIDSSTIQPPHPIFADINLKYLSGVVEYANRLYIILDVDRIFDADSKRRSAAGERMEGSIIVDRDVIGSDRAQGRPEGPPVLPDTGAGAPTGEPPAGRKADEGGALTVQFAAESLAALGSFYVSDLNRAWTEQRIDEWKDLCRRSGRAASLQDAGDSEAFLETFYSPNTGAFWSEDLSARLRRLLRADARAFSVWNPGCAKGHESYSIAGTLRRANQQARIKVWASDRDLLNIATAPNLVVPEAELPGYLRSFCVRGRQGFSFADEIKDLVVFEYHDIMHNNMVPDVDLIVARDILSFMKPDDQDRLLGEFADRLVDGGLLVLGSNEHLNRPETWKRAAEGPLNAYRKTSRASAAN